MPKRLIFSNNTPNDKGSIIPNNVIRWDRFRKNPVVLKNHKWEDDPIGFWTSIQNDAGLSVTAEGDLSGIPVLHEITDVAKTTKALYESGNLKAASIGGIATYKPDPAGRRDKEGNLLPYFNAQGYMECTDFDLYEISMVTLPSNEDAITHDGVAGQMSIFAAKCYTKEEIRRIEGTLTTLSTKYNLKPMDKTPEEIAAELAAEQAKAAKPNPAAAPAAAKPAPTTLATGAGTDNDILTMKASDLPGFMKKIVDTYHSIFGKPTAHNATIATPVDTPETKPASDAPLHVPQPGPIGMAAAAKAEMDAAHLAAEQALSAASALKSKAEGDKATDKDKSDFAAAKLTADSAMEKCRACADKYSAALKADAGDGDDVGMAADGADKDKDKDKKPTTHSAVKPKPVIKTIEELKAEQVKLAAAPLRMRVGGGAAGKTFTELAADKGEGKAVLNRVMARDATTGQKDITDYEVVLNSIINDSRYAAVTDRMRVMMNVNESEIPSIRSNRSKPQAMDAGMSLQHIAAQLAAGECEYLTRDNQLRKLTQLTSTDNALASPALNTIEWLPLAIFKLFPSTSWKNPIPIFGATITGVNTGIIWAEVEADPTIYKGTQPSNPANYSYSDAGISLSLTPYWLQPMIWTPLTMHQLRYDQMATGWAQAFAKWNAVMDDNLLYTLASTVPATSIMYSTGLSGYQTQAQQFNVNGVANINNFYWNPAFAGNLLSPVLNDMVIMEQIYNQQNFPMEDMDVRLVIDPIMEAKIKQDPEAKTLLTRFVTDDGKDLLKYSHTIFNQRSRVSIFDPASGQVKDPNGIIPATAVSAGVGFIPSQVGIGLGMLDVFMVQDPTNYGYKMSADIRIGIAPLRVDYAGTSLYVYGAGNV